MIRAMAIPLHLAQMVAFILRGQSSSRYSPISHMNSLFTFNLCQFSSSGLYIDGRKIGKGKRCVLRWGNQIAGGSHGNELFVYTYKLPKDACRIIETGRTRYELENEEMGHGMYSKVYKAKDLQHDGEYACKVTNRLTRAYSDVELRSMENEIELLKNLRHVSHTCRLFKSIPMARVSCFISPEQHSFISIDI